MPVENHMSILMVMVRNLKSVPIEWVINVFVTYYVYGDIPTYRVYRLYDNVILNIAPVKGITWIVV